MKPIKFLAFGAMCIASIAQSKAQEWVKPEISESTFASEIQTISETDSTIYYLYNVECKKFFYNGTAPSRNKWSTNAVLTDIGNPIIVSKYIDPETLVWDSKTYVIKNYYETKAKWFDIFIDNEYNLMIDRNAQANYMWEIEDKGNTFLIQAAEANPDYSATQIASLVQEGYSMYYMGFDDNDDEFLNSGTMAISPGITIDPAGAEYHKPHVVWAFIPENEYKLYLAKVEIYKQAEELADLIENTGTDYPEISTDKYIKVYENINSTIDELKQAIADLNAERRERDVFRTLDGATAANPKDATILIENPNFDQNGSQSKTVNGWIRTVTNATNNQQSKDAHTYTSVDGQYVVNKFLELWRRAADVNTAEHENPLGDGMIYQTIKNLPEGKYKFTVDALACCQITVEPDFYFNPVVGVELFAQGGEVETAQAIHTNTKNPEHYEVTFVSSGGDMTMGVRIVNTNATWVALDNFTLTYYGKSSGDPFQVALEATIENIENKYPYIDDTRANAEEKAIFAAALEEAKGTTENFDEVRKDLLEKLSVFESSVNDYIALNKLIEECVSEKDIYVENYPELSYLLDDFYLEWTDAYVEGTYTTEQINALNGVIRQTVVDYITQNMKAGDDITPLLLNPTFDADVSNWSSSTNAPVWGGKGTFTSGCAEVYKKVFNAWQILKNVPKGVYSIYVQGYERNDETAESFVDYYQKSKYAGNHAVLYANQYENTLISVLTDAKEELQQADDKFVDGIGYTPNTMDGANTYFNISPETYINQVVATLTEPGDLQIGLKTDYATSWVIFDNIKVVYEGDELSEYKYQAHELVSRLNNISESSDAIGTDAQAKITEATAELTSALTDADKADMALVFDKAVETANYAIKSINLYSSIPNHMEKLGDALELYAETATENALVQATTTFEETQSAIEKKNLTNEEVEALISKIEYAANMLKVPDYSNASDENPTDFTGLIINPTFDTVDDFSGWEGTAFGSGGTKSTNAQHYNKNFDTYQDIESLPAGTYKVSVQAFYRCGTFDNDYQIFTSETPETGQNASFYVTTSEETVSVPLQAISAGASSVNHGGNVSNITGTDLMVPNTMDAANYWFGIKNEDGTPTYYMNEIIVNLAEGSSLRIGVKKSTLISTDWCIFDNFSLLYYGNNSGQTPTDINSIESAPAAQGVFSLSGVKIADSIDSLKSYRGVVIYNNKKIMKY